MGSSACRPLALLLALLLGGAASAAERPNLLVILVDDLRADAIGQEFFDSPHIDRLAAEGVRFDDAFVITSLCSPSRATYLTGLYTHEHDVRSIWDRLDPKTVTLPRLLRAAGYETAWIGKWHLSDVDQPSGDFDRWVSFVAQGSYAHPTLNLDGEEIAHRGHMTDILTDHALEFLARERNRPFFLTLSHLAAHTPYLPQLHLQGAFDRVRFPKPASADEDREGKPAFLECRRVDEIHGRGLRGYFELLAGVDESVGKLLRLLEERGELDDTLLVFTSDNGYLFGEHLLSDKRAAYEESIRVPLILRYPRWFQPGVRVSGTLALNLDLAPTLLDAAGLAAPAPMRGLSLRAQAAGDARREEFLYVYYREWNDRNPRAQCTPDIAALRTLREKLILYPHTQEPVELYELNEDPREMLNRAESDEGRRRVAALRSRLEALCDSLGSDILRDEGEED